MLQIITVELGNAQTSQLQMENIKVISANQDNEEPQLRKSLFDKAAEEFSARLQNIQESRPLVKWLHSYRLAIWLPEIKHNKVY